MIVSLLDAVLWSAAAWGCLLGIGVLAWWQQAVVWQWSLLAITLAGLIGLGLLRRHLTGWLARSVAVAFGPLAWILVVLAAMMLPEEHGLGLLSCFLIALLTMPWSQLIISLNPACSVSAGMLVLSGYALLIIIAGNHLGRKSDGGTTNEEQGRHTAQLGTLYPAADCSENGLCRK